MPIINLLPQLQIHPIAPALKRTLKFFLFTNSRKLSFVSRGHRETLQEKEDYFSSFVCFLFCLSLLLLNDQWYECVETGGALPQLHSWACCLSMTVWCWPEHSDHLPEALVMQMPHTPGLMSTEAPKPICVPINQLRLFSLESKFLLPMDHLWPGKQQISLLSSGQ